jgi:acetoacetyl-CoA synthetase
VELVFKPSVEKILSSNFKRFLDYVNIESPSQLYDWSISEPRNFWQAVINFLGLKGNFAGEFLVNESDFVEARFFPDAEVSFIENIKQKTGPAVVYIGPSFKKIKLSIDELFDYIQIVASWLLRKKYRRIFCVCSNRPEALVFFLASLAIGGTFSIVSPETGSAIINSRIQEFVPDVVFVQNHFEFRGIKFNPVEELNFQGEVVILSDNFFGNMDNFDKNREVDIFQRFPFNTEMAVLFTSGTTGKPKGIRHSLGSFLLENSKELAIHLDIKDGDKLFYYTSTSWMMWYWMIGGLLRGATIFLFDGDPLGEDKLNLWKIVEQEEVTFFGTSAKHISISSKLKEKFNFNFNSLKAVISTGSPLLDYCFDFIYDKVKGDLYLYSISGGTDILGCFVLGCPILPIKKGCLQLRSLGYDVAVLDEAGNKITSKEGELCCLKPFISKPLGFLNDTANQRFLNTYFCKYPNLWAHGDWAILYEDGYMKILGRSDATLKPGGVRIGTSEIYNVVESLPEVIECIVAGRKRDDGDDDLVMFVVTSSQDFEAVKNKILQVIKAKLSPFHLPKIIKRVSAIPKTKNNKPVELVVSRYLNGQEVSGFETLDNPDLLKEFSLS